MTEALLDADGKEKYNYRVENETDKFDQLTAVKKYDGDKLMVEINYFYDEDSNLSQSQTYENGVLTKEEYYTSDNGFVYRATDIIYNADGSTTFNSYDQNGNLQ